MTVPERLRDNPTFQTQLEANRKNVISHFDLYASLREIAFVSGRSRLLVINRQFEEAGKWTNNTDFTNTIYKPSNISLLGSSVFHPLPKSRDCDALNVPFQYCSCRELFKETISSTFIAFKNMPSNVSTIRRSHVLSALSLLLA